MEALGGNAGT